MSESQLTWHAHPDGSQSAEWGRHRFGVRPLDGNRAGQWAYEWWRDSVNVTGGSLESCAAARSRCQSFAAELAGERGEE